MQFLCVKRVSWLIVDRSHFTVTCTIKLVILWPYLYKYVHVYVHIRHFLYVLPCLYVFIRPCTQSHITPKHTFATKKITFFLFRVFLSFPKWYLWFMREDEFWNWLRICGEAWLYAKRVLRRAAKATKVNQFWDVSKKLIIIEYLLS